MSLFVFPAVSVSLITFSRWGQWDTFVWLETSINEQSINDSIIGSRFYNSLIRVYSFLQNLCPKYFGITEIVMSPYQNFCYMYVFVFCEKHYWINVILRNGLYAKIYSPHRHVHCNKICKTAFYKSPNYPLKIKYHLLKTKYNQNIKYSPHLKKTQSKLTTSNRNLLIQLFFVIMYWNGCTSV